MQVTPIFRALTKDESSELQEAWQASRQGRKKEHISELSAFEATAMGQISSDGKVTHSASCLDKVEARCAKTRILLHIRLNKFQKAWSSTILV